MNFGTLCHVVKVWRNGPFHEEECRGAFFAVCCQSPFFVENCIFVFGLGKTFLLNEFWDTVPHCKSVVVRAF